MEKEELLKKFDEEVEQLYKKLDEMDIRSINASRGGKQTDLEVSKILYMKLQGKVPVEQILETDVDTFGECMGIFDVEISMDEAEELSEEKAKAILLDINDKRKEISRGAIGTLFKEHTTEEILEQRKNGLTYEQIVEKYYPIARIYNKELTEQDWDLFIESAILPKTKAEDGSLIPDYSFKETNQYNQLLALISELKPNDIMLKSSWWFDEFDPNRCQFKASKNGNDYVFGVHNPNITISRKSQSVHSQSEKRVYRVGYDEETKAYVLKEEDYIEYVGRKLATEASDGKIGKIRISYGGSSLEIEKAEKGIKIDHSYTQPRTKVFEILNETLQNGNSQQKAQLKKAIGDISEKEIIDAINEERISGAVHAILNYKYNKPREETLVYDINTGLQAMNDLYFSSEEGIEKLKEEYKEYGFDLPFRVPDFVKNNPELNTDLLHDLEEKCKIIVKEDPDYDPEIQNEDGSTKLEFSTDFIEIENDLGGMKKNIRRIVAKMIYLNNWDMIEQLWGLKIKKDELYNLYTACCDKDLNKMKVTMEMLQSGVLPKEDFHANLQSEEPVPFISDYTGIQSEMSDDEKLKFYQECSTDYLARREAIAKLKKSMSENDRLTAEEKEAAQLERQYEDYTKGKDGKTMEGE